MIKVTLFTTDDSCKEICDVKIAHVTMFERHEIVLRFIHNEEQLKFMDACIRNYVLFSCQGREITLLTESKNYQRVRVRFDAIN